MKLQAFIEKYGREVLYELAQSETTAELQEKLNTYSDVKIDLKLEELMSILYPLRGKKCPVDEDALEAVVGGRAPKLREPTPTFLPSLF